MCECIGHPFDCHGHPNTCACAKKLAEFVDSDQAAENQARQWAKLNNCAIVPLEPADAMLNKAAPYLDDEKECIRIAYKVMIAAAQESKS